MNISKILNCQPHLYVRKGRAYVSFAYDDTILETIKQMSRPWWGYKTQEWSFDEDSVSDFTRSHQTVTLNPDAIIFTKKNIIMFKFIQNQNLNDLESKIPNMEYNKKDHIFIIPSESYDNLIDFLNENKMNVCIKNLIPDVKVKKQF